MNDEAKHGIDAVVPSDTAQFDQESETPPEMTPERAEAVKSLSIQLGRYNQLVKVLLGTPKSWRTMVGEATVHEALNSAKHLALEKLLMEKLGVTQEEYMIEVSKQLDQMLELKQMEYKIIITPEGVWRAPNV